MTMMVNDRGAESCDRDNEFAGRDAVAGQYALVLALACTDRLCWLRLTEAPVLLSRE